MSEPGCPIELETLASRKFGKYYSYVEYHQRLRDCTNLKEAADISKKIIDNYMENRAIWDELNWYKQHGVVLGKHPVFREFNRRKELLGMSVKELVFRQQQIEQNIWRVKSELKKGDKPHLEVERKQRLAGYEAELREVKRLLE